MFLKIFFITGKGAHNSLRYFAFIIFVTSSIRETFIFLLASEQEYLVGLKPSDESRVNVQNDVTSEWLRSDKILKKKSGLFFSTLITNRWSMLTPVSLPIAVQRHVNQ